MHRQGPQPDHIYYLGGSQDWVSHSMRQKISGSVYSPGSWNATPARTPLFVAALKWNSSSFSCLYQNCRKPRHTLPRGQWFPPPSPSFSPTILLARAPSHSHLRCLYRKTLAKKETRKKKAFRRKHSPHYKFEVNDLQFLTAKETKTNLGVS